MKKYYLRHKYLGERFWNYLNYVHPDGEFYLAKNTENSAFQTKFTEEDIKMLEDSGFSIANFEKIEVK